MELETTILSEIAQIQKYKCWMLSLFVDVIFETPDIYISFEITDVSKFTGPLIWQV